MATLTPLAKGGSLAVAGLHVGFFVLEALLWTAPTGRKIFRMSKEKADTTKVLAANQGVYNLALAAVLAWAAVTPGQDKAALALLGFVAAVGAFGAATVSRTILYVQAVPALLALGAAYRGV